MTFAAAELTSLETVLVTMGTALLLILIGHAATLPQRGSRCAVGVKPSARSRAHGVKAVAQQALTVAKAIEKCPEVTKTGGNLRSWCSKRWLLPRRPAAIQRVTKANEETQTTVNKAMEIADRRSALC